VKFDAPHTATNTCARCSSPLVASMIGTVCPAQSTKSFSPAVCVWRIERRSVPTKSW
jgi:hypothetical protein